MDTFLQLRQRGAGVELGQLEALTTLLVWTRNSLYRLIVADGADVFVQGGAFFPDPTPAHVDGASTGGGPLMTGWIGVGLLVELRVGGQRILTSPVVAIAAEGPVVSRRH
jgi:hypothetical protein